MNRTTRPLSRKTATAQIIGIYERYHRPEYIGLDPLVTLQRFTAPEDLEVAGLIAAVLSYGRVETIIRSINDLFGRMGGEPSRFIAKTSLAQKMRLFDGFRHRFNDGADLALFLQAAGAIIDGYGSVERFFADAMEGPDGGIAGALISFSKSMRDTARRLCPALPRSFEFLVPSPVQGGACKRLNMFLRWMVRPDDGIDLGVWKRVQPALLRVPVDTHIAAVARRFGMTGRKNADWRMTEEVTAYLRGIDPFDPVRFDFSLCRRGVLAIRKDAA